MEKSEIIFEENNKDGLPGIRRLGNMFFITKASIPQFADMEFIPFFESVKEVIHNYKNIVIDFKLGYYNSSSNLIIRKLLDMLSSYAHICKPFVNWYYYENDEMMQEKGEILKEQNTKITFNLLRFKD